MGEHMRTAEKEKITAKAVIFASDRCVPASARNTDRPGNERDPAEGFAGCRQACINRMMQRRALISPRLHLHYTTAKAAFAMPDRAASLSFYRRFAKSRLSLRCARSPRTPPKKIDEK